ncbi:MAG: radical SAM protein [Spirochaetes bacterium]|nr:radical SAM protein [Spirochaetota bacterium]
MKDHKNMKITAVIEASRISNHFPNRYDLLVKEKSILDIILERLIRSDRISDIVLSTSDQKQDDILVDWAKKNSIKVSRKAYDDLIGRFYNAALAGRADLYVRISGSSPLISPCEIDTLVDEHLKKNVLYSYYEHYKGLILGLGCEVVAFRAVEKISKEEKGYARKVGISYLKEILNKDEIYVKNYKTIRPKYRVNMAVENDMVLLEQILEVEDNTDYLKIIKFLDAHPRLVHLASQAIAPVKEIGLEKIMLFPDKIEIFNRINIDQEKMDTSYPVSVELSLTNRCNLNCGWCSDAGIRKKAMVDLDFKVLKQLIDDLKENGCKGVVIEGGGEPTLYEKFNDVVQYIHDQGMSIGLFTNGVLLPYKDIIDHFSWIRISLDACSKDNYKKLKGIDKFNQVLENAHIIADHNAVCGIGYVVTRDNIDNLDSLVMTLRSLDVNYIQFRPVIDHPELSVKDDLEYLLKYSNEKFSVLTDAMNENRIKGNANCPCIAHSLNSVITADGDVYLCGRLNIHPNWKPIGNLYKNTFKEIWLGKERKEQILKVIDPEFCKANCPECKLTKYNVLFNKLGKMMTVDFI